MHETLCDDVEDQPTNDNLAGTAAGHRADGGILRRDLTATRVVGQAADALI